VTFKNLHMLFTRTR